MSASIVAFTGYSGLSVYSATKASMLGFTRSLAREVGRMGVNVNAVAPGFLDTEMTQGLADEQREQDCAPQRAAAAAGGRGRCRRGGIPARRQGPQHHRDGAHRRCRQHRLDRMIPTAAAARSAEKEICGDEYGGATGQQPQGMQARSPSEQRGDRGRRDAPRQRPQRPTGAEPQHREHAGKHQAGADRGKAALESLVPGPAAIAVPHAGDQEAQHRGRHEQARASRPRRPARPATLKPISVASMVPGPGVTRAMANSSMNSCGVSQCRTSTVWCWSGA